MSIFYLILLYRCSLLHVYYLLLTDVVLSQLTIKYDPVETECPEWDAQMMVNQVLFLLFFT